MANNKKHARFASERSGSRQRIYALSTLTGKAEPFRTPRIIRKVARKTLARLPAYTRIHVCTYFLAFYVTRNALELTPKSASHYSNPVLFSDSRRFFVILFFPRPPPCTRQVFSSFKKKKTKNEYKGREAHRRLPLKLVAPFQSLRT